MCSGSLLELVRVDTAPIPVKISETVGFCNVGSASSLSVSDSTDRLHVKTAKYLRKSGCDVTSVNGYTSKIHAENAASQQCLTQKQSANTS